jgi:transcriptional regulator with XRE-family HTH domain
LNKMQELLIINIKEARKKLDFSQMKLSIKCNISSSYIGEIESGRKFPSSETLLKISSALGLKPYQLFLDKNDKETFDKLLVLSSLFKELKEKLNDTLEDIIMKYLSETKK